MFKEVKKHFNSTTVRGRANVAKATYASFALLYIYMKFKKSRRRKEAVLAASSAALASSASPASAESAASAESSASAGSSTSAESSTSAANGRCSKCFAGTVCKENGNGVTGCVAQENGQNDKAHKEENGAAGYADTEERRRRCGTRVATQTTETPQTPEDTIS